MFNPEDLVVRYMATEILSPLTTRWWCATRHRSSWKKTPRSRSANSSVWLAHVWEQVGFRHFGDGVYVYTPCVEDLDTCVLELSRKIGIGIDPSGEGREER